MCAERQLTRGEVSWVVHDRLFFNEIKEQVGLEKAKDIYSKVWEKVGFAIITRAKQKLGIQEVKDFETFKSIMKSAAGSINDITEDSENRLVMELKWCPFSEVGRLLLQEPMGIPEGYDRSEWVRAAADALVDWDRGMVLATGLKGVSNTAESHMCLGDKTCRRVFEFKK